MGSSLFPFTDTNIRQNAYSKFQLLEREKDEPTLTVLRFERFGTKNPYSG